MYEKIHLFLIALFISANSIFAQSITSRPWQFTCDSSLYEELSNDKIEFLGGLELFDENDSHFGGLSALWARPGGNSILAFSDFTSISGPFSDTLRGQWYEFVPAYDSTMQLLSIELLKSGRLLSADSLPLSEIESVAADDSLLYLSRDNGKNMGGEVLKIPLSFFDNSGNYRVLTDALEVPGFPKDARQGFEAMDIFPGGQMLLIHETDNESKFADAWLIDIQTGDYTKKLYRLNETAAKGMTKTRNGDMLIIEKIFRKGHTKMAVSRLPRSQMQNDTLKADVLLRASSDCLDNFEGISTFVKDGQEYFFLITDNNGDWQKPGRQKSLLLLFRLNE